SFHTFLSHDDLTYLLSFPTRRSSDLVSYFPQISNVFLADSTGRRCSSTIHCFCTSSTLAPLDVRAYLIPGNSLNSSGTPIHGLRSEEHTSELQSRFDLVCRLLLEKKK